MSEKIGIAIADCLQANKGDTKFPLTGDERMERATGDFSRSLPKQENGKTRKTTAKKQQQEEMQFVIRLIGEKNIKETLTAETVHWTDNLETAVNQTVSLAKSKK